MKMVGLQDEIEKLCIPMIGRMIHDISGHKFMSLYSGKEDKYINSISRPGLNMLLLDSCRKITKCKLAF